jgi:hypothetical protein
MMSVVNPSAEIVLANLLRAVYWVKRDRGLQGDRSVGQSVVSEASCPD